jgi:hypothetical protein
MHACMHASMQGPSDMLPVLGIATLTSTAALITRHRRRRWHSAKPQRRFAVRLADNSDTPFQHLGQQQPAEQQEQQQHPYAGVIQALAQQPRCPFLPRSGTSLTQRSEPHEAAGAAQEPCCCCVPPEPAPLQDTPLTWVSTPRQLRAMLKQLQGVAVMGLDTEHNSQRSYQGLLCLMQISTGGLAGRASPGGCSCVVPCCSTRLRHTASKQPVNPLAPHWHSHAHRLC